MTTTQCIKVASLRKESGDPLINLKVWLDDPQNVYVGRPGRIFIDKEIFFYSGSKFANPYSLKEYNLERSLELYEDHLVTSGLIDQIEELRGKNLGCWCDQRGKCHAKILLKYLN